MSPAAAPLKGHPPAFEAGQTAPGERPRRSEQTALAQLSWPKSSAEMTRRTGRVLAYLDGFEFRRPSESIRRVTEAIVLFGERR